MLGGCRVGHDHRVPSTPADALNVFHLEDVARERLSEDAYHYLAGGADDLRTVAANRDGFRRIQIRARRLIDVRSIDTTLTLLDEPLRSPIVLAPVGFQGVFHDDAELATARAAAARDHLMIASSASNHSVGEIAAAGGRPVWFQLYPTTDRRITAKLLRRAESAGCRVVVLTVDTPMIGNREMHGVVLRDLIAGASRLGNYEGIRTDESINDPGMTWDMVDWLRRNTAMKIVLKGIVTHEDAALAARHRVDAILVSNHGGRQLDSERATTACLPEVVDAAGTIPVMIDGGFRRGTDIFKALALGARAVCIGRPYIYGLGAFGQVGVERALELLQAELVLDMQLAGAVDLAGITRSHVVWVG